MKVSFHGAFALIALSSGLTPCSAILLRNGNKADGDSEAEGLADFGGASETRALFRVDRVRDEGRAREILRHSPAGCVDFDPKKRVASFSVRPEDVFSSSKSTGHLPRILNSRGQGAGTRGVVCKDSSRVSTDYAIMVPTYIGHKRHYKRLVQSLETYVQGDLFELVSVFSSLEESKVIYEQCPACQSWIQRESWMTPKFDMRTLVFDYDYANRTTLLSKQTGELALDKFNYQCAKKLWALERLTQDRVILFDSDFTLIQPFNLPSMFSTYEHVLYETESRFPLDTMVLGSTNTLLNSSFTLFPLETPWIFTRSKTLQLVAYLKTHFGREDYYGHLLETNTTYFETVLYRLFILATDPEFYNVRPDIKRARRMHHHENFLFDMSLNSTERLWIEPPPIGISCVMQGKGQTCPSCHCNNCPMLLHNDRRGCVLNNENPTLKKGKH